MQRISSPLTKNGRAFFFEKERRKFIFNVRRGILPQMRGFGIVPVSAKSLYTSSPFIMPFSNLKSSFSASAVTSLQARVNGSSPYCFRSRATVSAETGSMVKSGTSSLPSSSKTSPRRLACLSSASSAVKSAARTRSSFSRARCNKSASRSSFSRLLFTFFCLLPERSNPLPTHVAAAKRREKSRHNQSARRK